MDKSGESGPLRSASAHEERDRQFFDGIAKAYCRKDLLPASRAARRQRLEQTLKPLPLSSTCRLLEVGCGDGEGDLGHGLAGLFDGEIHGVL